MDPYLYYPSDSRISSCAAIMSAHNVNLRVVLSDARRIIKANRGHFFALSLLFVLPLSFSTVYSSLSKPTPISSRYNRFLSSYTRVPDDEIPPVDKSYVILSVIYFLVELLLSFFATASITHSIVNGFFGEPLKFTSSLKSIVVSFFPLTATYIVSRLILGLIFFGVSGLSGFAYGWIMFSGGVTDFRDGYFLGFVILVMVLILGVVIYFQLEWYLADVIAVVESKWGYAPLRRSSDLVKGMRRVALSIFVLYSLLFGMMSFLYPAYSGSVRWLLDLQTVAFTGLVTMLRLYGVAATAVLFVYCKALRGELTSELDPLVVGLLHDGDDKAHKEVV